MLIKVDSKYVTGHNALKNTLLIGAKSSARNFYTSKGKRVLKMVKKTFPQATIEAIDAPHAPRGRGAVAAKRGRPPAAKRGPGRPPKARRGRPPKAMTAGGPKRGRGRPKGSKNKPKVETTMETAQPTA